MAGVYPQSYLRDPHVGAPDEAVYGDLDAWSYELDAEDPADVPRAGLVAILPPLYHEGVFVKGLYYSHGLDILVREVPRLREIAFGIANSMWCSYPWSKSADAMFTLYDNPARARWYAERNPQRASIVHVPIQDADMTRDDVFAPRGVRRDIDILTVARFADLKNLPMLAASLVALERRHGRRVRMSVAVGKRFGPGYEGLSQWDMVHVNEMAAEVDDLDRYVDWLPDVDYWRGMPEVYARSRCVVLGSLIEGKNRSLHEAMACDTPVVCFRDYNRAARGPEEVFPPGAGVYAEAFDPDALADALEEVLARGDELRPREAYLRFAGRRRAFDRSLGALSYYRDVLAIAGARPVHDDPWLDAAMRACHGISLTDFIYQQRWDAVAAVGVEDVRRLVTGWLDGVGSRLRLG